MNKTAIVYTKEEARAMDPKDRPICYRVTSKIYHAAFQAVCYPQWSANPNKAFDPDDGSKAALDMCFAVAEELERLGVTFEQINQEKPEPNAAPLTPSV